MEDLKTTGIAVTLGAVAVGGLWLARPAAARSTVSILDQWVPPTAEGPDADAAALFRIRLGGAVREAAEDGQLVEFRLVDREGNALGLVPAQSSQRGLYKLPRGYASVPATPRLVAMVNGRPVGSAPVGAIPEPTKVDLRPSPSSPLAFLWSQDRGMRVVTERPIPNDERWSVTIRRTPYRDVDLTFSLDAGGVRDPRRVFIPYAAQARLAEVDVERLRLVPRSEIVEVSGMRLQSRFGGTALIVDRKVSVATHLGLDLVLPRQDNGPRHPVRRGNGRTGWVSLSSHRVGGGAESDRRVGMRFQILSPKPESLGLRELRVGASSVRAEGPVGPLVERPFSIRGRLTRFDPVRIAKARYVVPIRVAASGDPKELASL